MANGLAESGGTWYYLTGSGAMAANTPGSEVITLMEAEPGYLVRQLARQQVEVPKQNYCH